MQNFEMGNKTMEKTQKAKEEMKEELKESIINDEKHEDKKILIRVRSYLRACGDYQEQKEKYCLDGIPTREDLRGDKNFCR